MVDAACNTPSVQLPDQPHSIAGGDARDVSSSIPTISETPTTFNVSCGNLDRWAQLAADLVRSDSEAVVVNLDIEPVETQTPCIWIDPVHRHP